MITAECSQRMITDDWIIERYELYKVILFRIAFSYLGNKHDCEDVLQEVFIKLCYHAPDFPDSESGKRWLIRVTINHCKNLLRSYWKRHKVDLEMAEEFTVEPEEREVLLEIIRLPIKYKTVIQLYYFVGYSISEISDMMNLSESAVKMRLKRGRELLKIEMENDDEGR
jgi:RNA polymerase sigma-70 factor (ECF subfamily)